MPITWKNVDAGESRTGVALLQGAQQNITAGLDGLKGLVDDRVEMKDANIRNERTNNTKAFAEELATYRDFDKYEAALDSGAIDALRTKYGENVDSTEMLKVQDTQFANLRSEVREDRKDIKSEDTFNAAQLKIETDPIIERINSAIQNNNPEEATALITKHKVILDRAGVTSDLENKGEKRITEVLNKSRADKVYDSTQTLTSVISQESVLNAPTENDAIAEAVGSEEFGKLLPKDQLEVSSKASAAWLNHNKLSKDDSDRIEAYTFQQNQSVTAALLNTNNILASDLAEYPVDANASFFSDPENNYSLGDAMNLADKNNYDKTAWIGDNKSVIEGTYKSVSDAFLDERKKSVNAMNKELVANGAAKEDLIKIPKELSPKDNRALNNIMYMAVGDMGDGLNEGLWDTKQELDDGPFGGLNARATELMQQYLVSADNQGKRDAAKKFHADETARIKNTSAKNVIEYSEAIKKSPQRIRKFAQNAIK